MATVELSRRPQRKVLGLNSRGWDQISNSVVLIFAGIVVTALVLIYLFVGSQAFQTFTIDHLSPGTFFLSKDWDNSFGTLAIVVGTISLVVIGLLIAVPLSIGIALFITEIAPPWMARILRSIVELFLGIPSVIFGLLGILVVVPFVANIINGIAGQEFFTTGKGIFAAGIVVAFMVMPTITTITVDSLVAIPRELREGSLALGATRWQTMTKTLIPAATPGIMTGVILGTARIIGETIAVGLVIGGSARIFPIDFVHGQLFIGSTSVMTTQIFHDFANATQGSPILNAIWTLSFFLIVISGVLVFVSRAITSRKVYK